MDGEIEFVTIDIQQDSYTVQSLMNYYDFSIPVALDSDGTVTETYNVIYTPTNIVIDREGVIRHIRKGAFANTEEILSILSDLE
jgi:cytochrome c biogenesis protein CcmG/thiol:disulfide interchange protein DsbE